MNLTPWETWQKIRLVGILCVLVSAFVLRNNQPANRGSGQGQSGYASGGGLDHGGSALAARSGLFAGRNIQRAGWWLLWIGVLLTSISLVLKKKAERREAKIIADYVAGQKLRAREQPAVVRDISDETRTP